MEKLCVILNANFALRAVMLALGYEHLRLGEGLESAVNDKPRVECIRRNAGYSNFTGTD